MKVFILTLGVVAVAVFAMCFNIIFRKDGSFPEYEVGSNKEMRRLGIRCMKEEQDAISLSDSRKSGVCQSEQDSECEGCALYQKH